MTEKKKSKGGESGREEKSPEVKISEGGEDGVRRRWRAEGDGKEGAGGWEVGNDHQRKSSAAVHSLQLRGDSQTPRISKKNQPAF